jgi:hypothetical protein
MMYIVWFFKALIDLSLVVINLPLAPLVATLSDKDGNLPKWLKWMQTNDNTLFGDDGWKNYHFINGSNTSWWARTNWMWRNPMGSFAYDVMGVIPEGWLTVVGNDKVGNRPLVEGSCFAKCANAWMVYYVKKVSDTKCIRIYLGYKLMTNIHEHTNERAMLVYSVNPFMGWSDKA